MVWSNCVFELEVVLWVQWSQSRLILVRISRSEYYLYIRTYRRHDDMRGRGRNGYRGGEGPTAQQGTEMDWPRCTGLWRMWSVRFAH